MTILQHINGLYALSGLVVGFLVGLTGVGGGSLMTPLLIVVFGIKPVTAVGTDLTYGAVTKTVGGWRHLRHRTVDMGLSTWISLGSLCDWVAIQAALSGSKRRRHSQASITAATESRRTDLFIAV